MCPTRVQDGGSATGKVGTDRNFGVWPVPGKHGVMGQEGSALAIPGLMISKESSSVSLCRAHGPGFAHRGKRRGSSGPWGPISCWAGCGSTTSLLPGLDRRQRPSSQPAVLHGTGAGCAQDRGARSPWIPALLRLQGGEEEDKEGGDSGCWEWRGWETHGKGVFRLPGEFWSRAVGSESRREWGREGMGIGKRRTGIMEEDDQGRRGQGPGKKGQGPRGDGGHGKEG